MPGAFQSLLNDLGRAPLDPRALATQDQRSDPLVSQLAGSMIPGVNVAQDYLRDPQHFNAAKSALDALILAYGGPESGFAEHGERVAFNGSSDGAMQVLGPIDKGTRLPQVGEDFQVVGIIKHKDRQLPHYVVSNGHEQYILPMESVSKLPVPKASPPMARWPFQYPSGFQEVGLILPGKK